MFHSSVSEDEGLLLAFHESFRVALLKQRAADLPVPVSLFIYPIISQRVYSMCTVNHRGKPGPLPAGVVRKISWLVLMFLLRLLGTSGTDPPHAFCFSRVTRTQSCQHPSPLLQRFFFSCRTSVWTGANPNRDLPVCPLSALTPAVVAFFSQRTGSRRLTGRQAGRVRNVSSGCSVCTCLPLIGTSPWKRPGSRAVARQYVEKNGDDKLAN